MILEARGRVRVEPAGKRVRAFLGGAPVFDTTRPVLVWEGPHFPVYYVPVADVDADLLVDTALTQRSPSRGEARFWSVRVGDRLAENAARQYPDSPIEAIRGLIRFEWSAMDSWFEEDEEVFTHARDPHHRVDILRSSRHVEVIVNGVTVADSHQPTLLFETGLPTRYYLPLTDVRIELLRPSSTATGCPYKGAASYWSLEVEGEPFEDVVWTYPSPLPESMRIAGLACFYNEQVDIRVDGVLQERPTSPFSQGVAAA
ncbi:MAG TPA: DUF427 domain-containing protein [Candidatus Saccharimonadales bacterium]|nr:DUF427 domain-containing protein [Candidatus Saccharimonadales bacterium]